MSRIQAFPRRVGSTWWRIDVSLRQDTKLMYRADHVDILGASPLNAAILKIAAGRGDLVEDQIESGILDYVEKMKWD